MSRFMPGQWMVTTQSHQQRQPVIGKPVPPAKRKNRATKPKRRKRRKR